MDKGFWNSFYKNKSVVDPPSSFAVFCVDEYIPKHATILELGSGNGRDALYFSDNQHHVIAVDQTAKTSMLENAKLTNFLTRDNLSIINDDFVQMDYSKYPSVNVVYSRFTLHSISLAQEDILLDKVYQSLQEDGVFLIEARTIKDPLCGVGKPEGDNAYFIDHYRRFIDTQKFIQKVISMKFEIVYFVESDGFSIYKGEDPVLMRIVLRKPNISDAP